LLTAFFVLASTRGEAQNLTSPAAAGRDPASVEANTVLAGHWEFTIDGRIFAPTGRLQPKLGARCASRFGGTRGKLSHLT
jgi:hypothetical protein